MDIREEAINRMLRIVEQVCRKLKIVICLPVFLKQRKFKDILEDNLQEFEDLYKICNGANLRHEYSITEESSSKDASQVTELRRKYAKINSQLQVILLHVTKYEDEIMSIVNDSLDEVTSYYKNIIENIQRLKLVVEREIRMTPKQLREDKIKLRNARDLVAVAQEEIQKLESAFNDQTLEHNDIVKESQDEIINLNLVIDEIKIKHNGELDREMNSYKTRLRGLKEDTDEEENNLNNQLEAYEAMLEKLMQVDIEQEKLLREDCKKVEGECLAARDAYDRDLSKLHELKETLEMQLYVTNNHYDTLKNEYEVQSELFVKLKKERDLAMMQAFAKQLDNFEKNRAARIIQRTWRAYHQRISSKKKKRTRKKK